MVARERRGVDLDISTGRLPYSYQALRFGKSISNVCLRHLTKLRGRLRIIPGCNVVIGENFKARSDLYLNSRSRDARLNRFPLRNILEVVRYLLMKRGKFEHFRRT